MLSLLVVLLLAASTTAQCLPNSPTVSCSSSVLYLIDFSNDCGPDYINLEIQSIANLSLPLLAYNKGQKVGVMPFGGANLTFPTLTSSYSEVCSQVDLLRTSLKNKDYGNTMYLNDLVQAVYNHYGNTIDNIVLYSAATDWNYIAMAGAFNNNFMPYTTWTSVIIEGWDGVWEEFGGTKIYTTGASYLTSPDLGRCIASNTCGGYDGCSTFYPNTTPVPPSTTISPNVVQPCADCIPSKTSVDLMFLIDNSYFTGQDGLNQIQSFIASSFSQYNIQTLNSTDPFHMRVGIYTYSGESVKVKALGTATYEDLKNLKIQCDVTQARTNMVDALWNVERYEFGSLAHRANAAKVVVVMGSTFVEGYYRYPSSDFAAFQETGGKVIVYELYKPGSNGFVLETLTNPVYYINSTDSSASEKMTDSLCKANCVCPSNTLSFANDPNSGAPIAGCYDYTNVVVSYVTGSRSCKARGGILAEFQTASKSSFLVKFGLQVANAQFSYNGLGWDNTANNWVWQDGKVSDGSYAPWANGGGHTPGLDCCSVSTDLQWHQVDCRNGYFYSCQIPPCDTSRAC